MRSVRIRSLPFVLLFVLLLAHAAGAAELVEIPGTDVSLPLPEGFAVAPDFPGIGVDADLTSVLVTELPVPYAISKQRFDAASLARGGVTLRRSDPIRVDGHEGLLLHATQTAAGLEFRKWLVVFGDDTDSILLAATTPLDQEARHQDALVETLRGAKWHKTAERVSELPFRIGEVPPFEIVSSASNAVVLADPSFEAPGVVPSLVTVGVSQATVQIGSLAGFARHRLTETPSIKEAEITSETDVELDGMPARRIEATAVDLEQDRPVRVLQLLATDGSHYFLVQGIADASRAEIFEPRFDRVGAVFTRTSPVAAGTPPETSSEPAPESTPAPSAESADATDGEGSAVSDSPETE